MTNPLEALAARAEREPAFLAWVLAAYARAEQLDDLGLVNALGCTPEDLLKLRLTGAPRDGGERFRYDIDRISKRYGLDPDRLIAIVKRGRVVARLQGNDAGVHEPGYLMAARDREDEAPEDGA